jgi:AraC-like DNA-binding protein
MSYLTEASPEKPYLVISLDLDIHLTTQLVAQIPPSKVLGGSFKGSAVSPTDPEVLKAFLRLVELLDKPEQIPILSPIILREVHLLLLLGSQGNLLRAVNTYGTQSNHVFQSINWLRENFQKPLDVDELAKRVNMAPPTFRRHFKIVTSMSPTQYHKHLRLYEAQRLMLENNEGATSASYAVGYESLTQFNREYKRLFGDAPQRNMAQLR